MKPWCRIIAQLMLLMSIAFAGSENEGKTGLAFLKIGVGARAAGMGEAYTAVAGDAFATYWNPAGLLAAGQSNVGFQHNEWLLDVRGEFAALQFKWARSSLAFHVYNVNVGDIEVRTAPTANPLEKTSAHYASAGISYARTFGERLGLGVTVKYLFEKLFVYDAAGVAVDVGFRYAEILPQVTIAGAVQHLGSMGKLNRESSRLPTTLRFGAVYAFSRPMGPARILLAADAVKPVEENLRLHVGTEVALWEQLILRAGGISGSESRTVSLGVGIR
ncbi:MAG: hypothetical protein D6681_14685, partial [Calditrichaeota bacterium]